MAGEDQALKILQSQVESLTAQLQTLTSERDEYRDALSSVSEERDGLKATPEASARIAELEAKIRDRTHYDKFAELARGEKAKENAVKNLWKLSDYKAEGDEPDEAKLKEVLKRLKAEADYAFDAADAPGSPNKPPLPAPPAGGRSARNDGGDGTVLTADMLANPAFMLDPRNKAFISEAVKQRQEQRARENHLAGTVIR